MRFHPFAAILAMAVALAPGLAAAASAEEVAEVFRRSCLDHLPDFAGSTAELEKLGFVFSNSMFHREAPGGEMLAAVDGPDADAASMCLVNAELPSDAAIAPILAATIAERTGGRFNHYTVGKNGVRAETFSWRAGEFLVSVALVPDVMEMYSLTVLVGMAPQ